MNTPLFKLSGFTDEASSDLDKQIAITKSLGWTHLSARTIGSANIHDISETEFEQACDKLISAKIEVAEFGTLIGSWGKSIMSDWEVTLGEIERCIPRMQRLGVQHARIMSYAQEPWGEEQHEKERFKRLNEITKRFADAGLQALHENCMNWGGFSAEHTLRLLEEVPGLQLVFDTGNPIFQRDRSAPEPHSWQRPFEFYSKVKHTIAHIHIKDAIMHEDKGEPEYTFPGEGEGQLDRIMKDLIKSNYSGTIAIEPHMGKVFHVSDKNEDNQAAYDIYLEYGRRFEKFVNTLA